MTTTDDAVTTAATPTTPPRQRRPRRTDGDSGPAPRRTRRPQPSGEDLVAQLPAMVDRLIAENRELKRAIARAERGAGDGLGQAARALSGLQRRVSRALAAGADGGRRRDAAAEAAPAPRPRRKVTDPEVLERRRAALAKARAAKGAAGG